MYSNLLSWWSNRKKNLKECMFREYKRTKVLVNELNNFYMLTKKEDQEK